MFVDAKAKRTAALKEQEEQLLKFKLIKQLALAQAEMEASTISDLNEDLLPGLIGKSDLLIDHCHASVISVKHKSSYSGHNCPLWS